MIVPSPVTPDAAVTAADLAVPEYVRSAGAVYDSLAAVASILLMIMLVVVVASLYVVESVGVNFTATPLYVPALI